MDMNTATLPKKDLKTRPYNIGMEKRDLKTRPYSMDMNKEDLEKLSKLELIKMLLERDSVDKPIPKPRTGKWESVKPKAVPRKSINEDIILQPLKQFRDRPPKPTRKPPPIPQVEEKEHITDVSVPKVKELNQALKVHAKSYDIKIPVIFHNLQGYNSNFIMQQIGEIAKKHAYTNKKGEKQDLNINAYQTIWKSIWPLC